jgi:hypothetical protein
VKESVIKRVCATRPCCKLSNILCETWQTFILVYKCKIFFFITWYYTIFKGLNMEVRHIILHRVDQLCFKFVRLAEVIFIITVYRFCRINKIKYNYYWTQNWWLNFVNQLVKFSYFILAACQEIQHGDHFTNSWERW